MRQRRQLLSIAASVFAVFALVLVVTTFASVGNPFDPFDDRRFSTKGWSATSGMGDRERRAAMARDLVARHLPHGMDKKNVEKLLGPPDGIPTKEDAGGNRLPGTHVYEYYLGSWSGYGFDDAFLYVCFDASDQVMHAEINGY